MTQLLDAVRFQPEAQLIQDLFERFSLETLVAHAEESDESEPERSLVLSTQLRLTPLLAPRLCALFEEVKQRLDFREAVELFVQSESNVNGFSLRSPGHDKTHVVSLTSGLVERMTDDELRFVMGHELGHIHYNHHRPRLILVTLGEDEEGNSRIPPLLQRRMESWERLSELSADRAGFMAVEGRLEPVVSAFFKMISGLGPEHLRFDIDAFLGQLADLQQMKRREVLARFSHPVTPVRVRALQLFGEQLQRQGGIQKAAEAAFEQEGRAVDLEVSRLAQLMEFEVTEPLGIHARDFLLAAGLLAADADGQGMSPEEHAVMVDLLLPLSSDPDEQLSRLSTRPRARDLMRKSGAWLRENAGEERFELFRQVIHVLAVDGLLTAEEKRYALGVARVLAIPQKAATDMVYEVLGEYLQSRPSGHPTLFKAPVARQRHHKRPNPADTLVTPQGDSQ